MATKIAIMQPYAFPYAGYFRLMANTDLFVVLDTVQFNRRGRVHRCELMSRSKNRTWFTLPMKRLSRDTTQIRYLEWMPQANAEMEKQMRRFPVFDRRKMGSAVDTIMPRTLRGNPLSYITESIERTCEYLRLPLSLDYASRISIDPDLRGQDRIIALCRRLRADTYVNTPGGRDLYDPEEFKKNGIKLEFLPGWLGDFGSILERVAQCGSHDIRQEIMGQL